jgi:AcrR family transcriptional regulator
MSHDAGPLTPGGHAWWAARPVAATIARRGRPPVGLSRIVAVALEIVDEVGVQAFTMRMLADRLSSGTATLYRYFTSKDEIMAHVLDLVLGEVEVEPAHVAGRNWQEAMTLAADRFYRVLRRHPNVLPQFVRQIPVGPNGMANRERVLGLLLAHGFAPDLAARAFQAIGHYVIGFAIQQASPDSTDRDAKDLHDFFQSVDAATFPAIAATATFLRASTVDEEFHFGLKLLLTGIDHLHARSVGSTSSAPGSS